ncbi:MAG: hypothetical protein CL927_11165 [Deltaproteobacteria bacterium]|nr:hypothetical protein [Deltaproteobacteria bacterium]HCH64853.1 hypothetical protein [Deltaproteobacteria bacterium]
MHRVATMGAALSLGFGCGPVEKRTTDGAPTEDSGVVLTPPSASPDDLAAQSVCINEVMPSNELSLILDDGSSPDWIELHNPSDREVDLMGWVMRNESAGLDGRLDSLGLLPAGGFVLLFADESSAEAPHLPFTLSKEGATITLVRPDNGGDRVTYGEIDTDDSLYRTTDCCASTDPECFAGAFGGTPGTSNRSG